MFAACVVLLWCEAPGAAAAVDGLPLTCETAGLDAERRFGLPSGLLLAIGRVESGWFAPKAKRVLGWPWTINANGQGQRFESLEHAIADTQALLTRGVTSIDVGCYQINLFYHPEAFRSLSDAFDPQENANYAAAFLKGLYNRLGDWGLAVAAYHSTTPTVGLEYRVRVLANMSQVEGTLVAIVDPRDAVLKWHPRIAENSVLISIPSTSGRAPAVISLPLTGVVSNPKMPIVVHGRP